MNRGSGLRIGRILGIPIYLHSTWVFIFAAITYIIASQFKQQHPLWTDTQHWTVGVLTSLLFFASVLFHELGHSVVAQHYKIRVVSITLFLLEASRASSGSLPTRFRNSISRSLDRCQRLPRRKFFWLNASLPLQPDGRSTGHLALPQPMLRLPFQSLAGSPLDGGRIFRAIVWGATKNFEKATRVAGASGKLIAYAMTSSVPMAYLTASFNKAMDRLHRLVHFECRAGEASAQVAIRETLAGLSPPTS